MTDVPGPKPVSTSHRPAPRLAFVFITLLIDALGIGLIIPVGPQLVAAVMGIARENAQSVAPTYGWLLATYAIMQFTFAPILGSLSDRFGRRPVILISLAGSAIDYFAGALVVVYAPHIALIFLTRAVNGISGANVTACNAYIADITPPEKRAVGFAVIGAAFGLGFMFGPLIGGLLGDPNLSLPLIGPGRVYYPYVAAGILCTCNWLYGFFVMPESLTRENRRQFSWKKSNPFGAFHWLLGHNVVITLVGALFLLNVAQLALHSTWNLSMGMRFGWTSEQIGYSLCTVGVAAFIVQGFLARKLIPFLGERRCLLLGIVLGTAAFAGYGLVPEAWMIYAIIVFASVGGVAQGAVQGIMSKAVPRNEQGLLQGAIAGMQGIASIVGPLCGTRIFAHFTAPAVVHKFPGAPFVFGASLYALSFIPISMVWKRMPTKVREAPVETHV